MNELFNAPDEALAVRLDALLRRAVDRGKHVRHGLLGLASVDGSWSREGAYGVADSEGREIGTATRYPMASFTKLYTAVVVLLLTEQGKLSLSDRLVDSLPSEVTRGLHVADGVDRTVDITLEHLLGHTSGFPDYYEEAPRGGRSAQARLPAGEDAPMPFAEVLRLVREVLRLVREELEPHFPPQPLHEPKRRARYADTKTTSSWARSSNRSPVSRCTRCNVLRPHDGGRRCSRFRR